MSNLNLYQKISNILSEKVPSETTEWEKRFPTNNANHSVGEQLENANNYWRTKLAVLSSSSDTLEARACLANNQDHKAWLDDFRTVVVPTIKNSKV